jgi:5,10-methylenetetrahydromethanopterin reductase
MNSSRPTFGISTMNTFPRGEFVEIVQLAENLGYDHFWVSDSSLHSYYVYSYLTLAAVNTSRIKLGTNCTHPLSVHPAVTINAMATTNQIANGRAILGIGSGGGPVGELGYRAQGAKVKEVEDMVTIAKRLFKGERVDYHGREFEINDAVLMFGLGECDPPQVYVTASGPRMLEMAGRVADGVLMCCGASTEGLEFALAQVRKGAESAGRSLDEIDLAWHVFGTFEPDPVKAHRVGAEGCSFLVNWFPIYCELSGISADSVAAIKEAYVGARHFTEAHSAHALVTGQMVEKLTVSGDAKVWNKFLDLARQAGISHVELLPIAGIDRLMHDDFVPVLKGLAEEVVVPWRRTSAQPA